MASAEILIDNKTLDEAQDYIIQNALTEVQNIIKIDLEQLKEKAQDYKNLIEASAIQIAEIEELLQRQSNLRKANNRDANVYNNIEEYKNNKDIISDFLHKKEVLPNLYKATFNFQQAVNNFLGQEVQTIFVYENGDGTPNLYNIEPTQLLTYDYTNSNRVTGRYQNLNKAARSALTALSFEDSDNEGLNNLKDTYKESMARYRASKVRRVMWINPRKPPKWLVMRVVSEGDINEAYATVVLTRNVNKYFLNIDLENNIDIFMMNFVQAVDSISGLLQGDAEYENIQYAIKSVDSSTLGLSQCLFLANEILKDNFTKEKLQKIKEEWASQGRTRNKIETSLTNTVNQHIQQVENEIVKLGGRLT